MPDEQGDLPEALRGIGASGPGGVAPTTRDTAASGVTGAQGSGTNELKAQSDQGKVCAPRPADPLASSPNIQEPILPAAQTCRFPPDSPLPQATGTPDLPVALKPLKEVIKRPRASKLPGRVHPWKPRTPTQIKEFSVLWVNPDVTIGQIARRYQASTRAVQRWSKEWALPRKDDMVKLAAKAASMSLGASDLVSTMTSAVKQTVALVKAQVDPDERPDKDGPNDSNGEGAISAPIYPRGYDGPLMDPEVLQKEWNPLLDKEIAAELEGVRQEARRITQHSDLMVIQRKLARLAILVSTKMPVYTWESLQTIVDSMSRTVLWSRKVEAEIPQGKTDAVLLRQEAGRQLMRELREVLNPEEQAALAIIVKAGADRIMAKKGIVAVRVEGNGNA